MAAKLIITPEAEEDVAEAYAWYERQRTGLGEPFLTAVDDCIQRLLRAPQAHQTIYDQYRRGLVRRFPYAVIYECDQNMVIVYCVFHTSRDPEKWRARLP
jgi:plasmid stabilization system protein ParE